MTHEEKINNLVKDFNRIFNIELYASSKFSLLKDLLLGAIENKLLNPSFEKRIDYLLKNKFTNLLKFKNLEDENIVALNFLKTDFYFEVAAYAPKEAFRLNCEECKYAVFSEDRSVGIGWGLEECNCKEVSEDVFNLNIGYYEEYKYPYICNCFSPIIIDKCSNPLCKKIIDSPRYTWKILADGIYEKLPVCCDKCKEHIEEQTDFFYKKEEQYVSN